MGGFYANITLKTDRLDAVRDVLRLNNVPATIAADAGYIVVADARLDEQEEDWLRELTERLSAAAACPALGALVHDDSILMLELAQNGEMIMSYNSCPSYFLDEEPKPPSGGDTAALVHAFGSNVEEGKLLSVLSAALPADPAESFPYAFESDRHREIVSILALPTWTVFFTHAGIAESPPEGFDNSFLQPVL